MTVGDRAPIWEELKGLDYFLEHLARAVERGEVPLESYEQLAPRYLERRAELVLILTPPAAASVAPPTATAATPATAHVAASPRTLAATSSAARTDAHLAPPPTAHVMPPLKPLRVEWATILAYVGAFLVIVASAIFAIATWDQFSVEFRIAFLGILTAGFYAAGTFVRTRLELKAGGIVLIAVGSTMLLFDGWIFINGYNLDGPWPWAAWMLVCSLIYWWTETRIASRYFGVIGAGAQVAWWWLLAQGLGWTVAPRMAVISVVAVLWVLVAKRARDHEPVASLAQVLEWAAPVVVVIAAAGFMMDLGIAPLGWTEIISALVIGFSAMCVFDLIGLPRGFAAILQIPTILAISSMWFEPTWTLVLVTAAAAVVWMLYELFRGGIGHGVVALFAEFMAWGMLAEMYSWENDVAVAVFATVGASWIVAAHLLRSASAEESWPGSESMELSARFGGYALLALATVAMPLAREVLPLSGSVVGGRDVALAAGIGVLWAVAALMERRGEYAIPAIVLDLYVVAALMAWLAPEWHSALYAAGFITVASVWMLLRTQVERIFALPGLVMAWGMRAFSLLVVPVGFLAAATFFEVRAWESALLCVVAGAYWVLDAEIAEEQREGLALAACFFVAAAGLLGWWQVDLETGAVVGALTALALQGVAALLRGRQGWDGLFPMSASVTGVVACIAAIGTPDYLALAFALMALSWAATALISRFAEAFAGAGILCLLATVSLIEHLDTTSIVTIGVILAVSAVFLAPAALISRQAEGYLKRATAALAVSGLLGPLILVALRAGGVLSGWTAIPGWTDIGEQGLVVALFALGGYLAALSVIYSAEEIAYLAGAIFTLAVMVEVQALDVEQIGAYTTPVACYIAWVGYQWARIRPDVRPPLAADVGATTVALVPVTLAALTPVINQQEWQPLVWAVGLSLVAIALGVLMRVRAYFFGGIAALIVLALWRAWMFYVSYWWLTLGTIGIAMLIIALTWQRQQMIIESVKERMADTFAGWR